MHTVIPTLRFEEDPELVVTISMGLLTANFILDEAQQMTHFEDAIELARTIACHGPGTAAFATFEKRRRTRVT